MHALYVVHLPFVVANTLLHVSCFLACSNTLSHDQPVGCGGVSLVSVVSSTGISTAKDKFLLSTSNISIIGTKQYQIKPLTNLGCEKKAFGDQFTHKVF